VWRNSTLPPEARIAWIIAMIVIAGIAMPMYFARHEPSTPS